MSKRKLLATVNTRSGELDGHMYQIKRVKGDASCNGLLTLLTTEIGFSDAGLEDSALECTGDGYIFIDYHSKKEIRLDYSQAHMLRILLDLMEPKLEYKIFKESN